MLQILLKYILHKEGWRRISAFIREKRPLCSIDHIAKEVDNALWKHCWLRGAIGIAEVKPYQVLLYV